MGGKQQGIAAFLKPDVVRTPSTLQACPGLTNTHHPRISKYLSRTVMLHGGSPHRSALVKRFLDADSTLKLSSKRLDAMVKSAELAEAKWSNHHTSASVFSVDCLRSVNVSTGHDPSPCSPCLRVLRDHIFQNALRRPVPDASNAKFTPHTYRNKLFGEAFARHMDVHELILTVGLSHLTPLMHANHNYSRKENDGKYLVLVLPKDVMEDSVPSWG